MARMCRNRMHFMGFSMSGLQFYFFSLRQQTNTGDQSLRATSAGHRQQPRRHVAMQRHPGALNLVRECNGNHAVLRLQDQVALAPTIAMTDPYSLVQAGSEFQHQRCREMSAILMIGKATGTRRHGAQVLHWPAIRVSAQRALAWRELHAQDVFEPMRRLPVQ